MSFTPRHARTPNPRGPAAAALIAMTVSVAAPSGAASNVLSVPIRGLRSDSGQVGCLLFASASGFPGNPDKAVGRQFTPIASRFATCVFNDVAPGSYAIAAIHDENGNGKLDKNFLGIPTEGYGASRDARGTLGPPKWEDAVFAYGGGTLQVPLVIHY